LACDRREFVIHSVSSMASLSSTSSSSKAPGTSAAQPVSMLSQRCP
jgi:hypothetical protein